MLRFKHYIQLLEAKIDDYKAQVTDISTEHDPHAKHKSASDIIDHFHKHVPGGNVQNTRWLIDRYKKGEMKQEDAPDMHDTLKDFEKYKQHLPKKNIGQYKSIADLKTAIHPHKEKDEQVKQLNQDTIDWGSTVVHDSPKVTAYHVHEMEAAQELGKTPKGEKLGWCTSHPDPDQNMFDHYNEKSKENFHILHMHHEKFPYRRIGGVGVEGQFQDENNELIHGKDFHNLIHRNPELKHIPAVSKSTHYKTQMASDPNASKEDLSKLLEEPNSNDIRKSIAGHKNATKEHLDKLANDDSYWVRTGVAANKNATKEHLDKLVNDKSEDVRAAVAKNSPHKEHLDKLSNDDSQKVKTELPQNKNATKEHLDKLINDDSSYVRREVAKHSPHKEHLDKLVDDNQENVRINVASNKHATKEHLDKLANDKEVNPRAAVAQHSSNKEHLDKLSNDRENIVRQGLAKNDNLPKEHMDKLVNDDSSHVREELARNNNIHKEHLDKLSNDPSEQVKYAVAQNKNATKEHLDKFVNGANSTHYAYNFKKAVVDHPNATKEHLDKLKNDSSEEIASKAKGRLNTKDYME